MRSSCSIPRKAMAATNWCLVFFFFFSLESDSRSTLQDYTILLWLWVKKEIILVAVICGSHWQEMAFMMKSLQLRLKSVCQFYELNISIYVLR